MYLLYTYTQTPIAYGMPPIWAVMTFPFYQNCVITGGSVDTYNLYTTVFKNRNACVNMQYKYQIAKWE